MQEDLAFVPMIAAALRQSDPEAALAEAFAKLKAMGQVLARQRCYRQFLAFMRQVQQTRPAVVSTPPVPSPRDIRILLYRQGQQVEALWFPAGTGTGIVPGIIPGPYQLITDTGWLLWEDRLTPEDLLWSVAFPGRALPMAADTEASARQPTRQVDLLDGTVILRTYAGLESGLLQIDVVRAGTSDHER